MTKEGFLTGADLMAILANQSAGNAVENYFKLLYYFDNGSLVGFADYLYSRQISNLVQIRPPRDVDGPCCPEFSNSLFPP